MDEGSEAWRDSIYLGKIVGCRVKGCLRPASLGRSLAWEQQGKLLQQRDTVRVTGYEEHLCLRGGEMRAKNEAKVILEAALHSEGSQIRLDPHSLTQPRYSQRCPL